jgi:hypothetical protein
MNQGVLKEQQFSTLTSGLYELRSCLELYDVFHVAMESTSIYWIPICNYLFDNYKDSKYAQINQLELNILY